MPGQGLDGWLFVVKVRYICNHRKNCAGGCGNLSIGKLDKQRYIYLFICSFWLELFSTCEYFFTNDRRTVHFHFQILCPVELFHFFLLICFILNELNVSLQISTFQTMTGKCVKTPKLNEGKIFQYNTFLLSLTKRTALKKLNASIDLCKIFYVGTWKK